LRSAVRNEVLNVLPVIGLKRQIMLSYNTNLLPTIQWEGTADCVGTPVRWSSFR